MHNQFEDFLAHSLDGCIDSKVKEAALYALLNGGKRVRPKLLFACLEAYRTSIEKGFGAASAIEMVHTYSLIHDDLPAMDNDSLRRGKPTCHIAYGEAIAILAGDALLTQSMLSAASATANTSVNLTLVKELSEYSGINGMIYGQECDILYENKIIDNVSILENIHFYKTAKLITLPFIMAANIANKDNDIQTWIEIGNAIGLLFQIQDDVFDVIKTSEELGKNAQSDLENNKSTYVSLLGIDKCNELIQELYDKSISLLDTLVIDKEPLIKMFDYLLNRSN